MIQLSQQHQQHQQGPFDSSVEGGPAAAGGAAEARGGEFHDHHGGIDTSSGAMRRSSPPIIAQVATFPSESGPMVHLFEAVEGRIAKQGCDGGNNAHPQEAVGGMIMCTGMKRPSPSSSLMAGDGIEEEGGGGMKRSNVAVAAGGEGGGWEDGDRAPRTDEVRPRPLYTDAALLTCMIIRY